MAFGEATYRGNYTFKNPSTGEDETYRVDPYGRVFSGDQHIGNVGYKGQVNSLRDESNNTQVLGRLTRDPSTGQTTYKEVNRGEGGGYGPTSTGGYESIPADYGPVPEDVRTSPSGRQHEYFHNQKVRQYEQTGVWPSKSGSPTSGPWREGAVSGDGSGGDGGGGGSGDGSGGGGSGGGGSNRRSTPTLSQVAPYTPEGETLVEDRITGLLAAGNPYVEAARQRGLRQAHARGLLNSSIATQSGEAAAIEAAFPIASQDASYFQEAGLLGFQGDIQSRLAREQHGYDIGTIGAQEAASSRLSEQEAEQNLEYEEYRAAWERDMREQLAGMQLSSEEKRTFGDQMTRLGEEYLSQVSNVQRDPNVNHHAKSGILANLREEYLAQLESLAGIYGVDIDWVLLTAAEEPKYWG